MKINQVVVIGSGTMGSGIAAQLCNANIPVTLLDLKTEISEKAKDRIYKSRPPLLIDKSKNLMLFSDNITNHSQLKSWLGKNIEVFKTKEFENVIKRQNYQKIQFDPNYTTQSQANSIIKYSNSFICLIVESPIDRLGTLIILSNDRSS